ncbi:MAG: PotD/PotF family extracellular solute-binding protein [Chloroflexota bacterium]
MGPTSYLEVRKVQRRHVLTTTLIVALAVFAFGSAAAAAENEAGRELRLYNWEEYVDPQVVADFEAEFGIDVIVETFSDENEMVSAIQADTSRYDMFITSDGVIYEMAEQRLLSELDLGNIPNLANVDPRFLDLQSDPGNRYSVPYDWGTTGITYDTDCVEPAKESWGLLLDPSIAGRVAMDADFDVALSSMLKFLGYPLNSSDPAQVAEATGVLADMTIDQGLQLLTWDEMLDRLASGELCAGQTFNGDAATYLEENDQLAFFVPREGSDFYVDSMAITRDAPNKLGAELFINYMLRPEVHARNNDFTGYAVPNRASIEGGYVSAESLADPVRYPDTERLESWDAFDEDRWTLWNKAWSDFVTTTG